MPLRDEMFELSEDATTKSLAGRRFYRVRCCERPMYQKMVYTLMPTDNRLAIVSLSVLHCRECNRELELETLPVLSDKRTELRRDKLWEYLGVETPYPIKKGRPPRKKK